MLAELGLPVHDIEVYIPTEHCLAMLFISLTFVNKFIAVIFGKLASLIW